MRQKCKVCGKQGTVSNGVEELHYKGNYLGLFKVEKCSSCGEVVYPPEAWQKIRNIDALLTLPPNYTEKTAKFAVFPIEELPIESSQGISASVTPEPISAINCNVSKTNALEASTVNLQFQQVSTIQRDKRRTFA
jgi:hypothetical protein